MGCGASSPSDCSTGLSARKLPDPPSASRGVVDAMRVNGSSESAPTVSCRNTLSSNLSTRCVRNSVAGAESLAASCTPFQAQDVAFEGALVTAQRTTVSQYGENLVELCYVSSYPT